MEIEDAFVFPKIMLHTGEKSLVYKLFDKRDTFHFLLFACLTLIVTSPNQYFILLLFGEFLRIARSSLLYKDFHENAMELLNEMKAHWAQSLRG